ncbi:MAG TPA: PilN domain-containing protein [Candidatus Angelobacter sp.]|nr:PilN domain-containing protein [Candidatus Angelobacter sp.]
MINLLPYDTKQQLRAAHANSILIKYMIFLGFAIAFLALACATVYFLLLNNKTIAEELAKNAQPTKAATSYSSAKQQAETMRTNIATAKSILDQQTNYSNIITEIAAALPAGIMLDKLSLSNSTIGTPITLEASALSAANVPKMKENFEKSTLFSNYSLGSIVTDQSDSSGYPVTISINVTINKVIAQ